MWENEGDNGTTGRFPLPTKRQFDMVVLTILLAHPVAGLFKMWATRKAADNDSTLGTVAAGAARIMS